MDIQEIALNTFTIAALLLTATIILLNLSWKILKPLIQTLPDDKHRIMIFKLKSISDPLKQKNTSMLESNSLLVYFPLLRL